MALNMHHVAPDCDMENIGPYRTPAKLGFRREVHFVKSFSVSVVHTSEYQYGMLEREWREKVKSG